MAHLSMYIMMYPYPPSTQRSLGFLALFHDIPRLFPAPSSRSATQRGARLAVYKIAFSDLTKKTFYCCPSPKRMSRKGSEWSLKCQMCRWFLFFGRGKKEGLNEESSLMIFFVNFWDFDKQHIGIWLDLIVNEHKWSRGSREEKITGNSLYSKWCRKDSHWCPDHFLHQTNFWVFWLI
jgi:hypothetical protein